MSVNVRYFASLREALGANQPLVLPAQPCTVAQVRDHLIASSATHAEALARSRALRCALNQVLCSEDTPVPDGSELAFFPPVTGG